MYRKKKKVFFTLFFLLVFSPQVLTQVNLEVISPSQKLLPGEFVTQVFSLLNREVTSHQYNLEVELPEGWSLLGEPPSLYLGPGEKQVIFLTTLIPPITLAGTYVLNMTVYATDNPSIVNSVESSVEILPIRRVKVMAPAGKRVGRGKEITYSFLIINKGNSSNEFQFSFLSSPSWKVEPSAGFLNLKPGETRKIKVILPVPEKPARERHLLKLRVISTSLPQVTAQGNVLTTILPPHPDQVDQVLYQRVPAQLNLCFSGLAEEGDFTSRVSLSSAGAMGEKPRVRLQSAISDLAEPELDSFRFNLAAETWDLTLGDISVNLTDLIGLSGRGALLYLQPSGTFPSNYVFSGTVGSEQTSLAAQMAFNLGETNLSLTTIQEWENNSPSNIWDLSLRQPISQRLNLSVEGALSFRGNTNDGAWRVSPFWEEDNFSLEAEYLKAGTNYTGLRSDTEGEGLSFRYHPSNSALIEFSLGHYQNNVNRDPSRPTILTDNYLVSYYTGEEYLPSGLPPYTVRAELIKRRDLKEPRETDEIEKNVQWGTGFVWEPASIYLAGKLGEKYDRINHEKTKLSGYRVGLSLPLDRFSARFWMGENWEFNLKSGELTRSVENNVKLSYPLIPDKIITTLTFSHQEKEETKNAALLKIDYKIGRDVSLFVELEREESPPGIVDWNTYLGVSVGYPFNLPLPWVKVKGAVEGIAFLDSNNNHRYDEGEEAFPNIIIHIDNIQVSTDERGHYRSPPLKSGDYSLKVSGLPVGYVAGIPLPLKLKVGKGKVLTRNIPVNRVAIIQGRVFEDENRNGLRDPGESGIPAVRVTIINEILPSPETFTDSEGKFIFFDLLPGHYVVSVDSTWLPEGYELTTVGEISATIKAEETVFLCFGATRRKREIIITFAPPQADFSYQPDIPGIGETVVFDASTSFDPDGEIEKYQWDIDGDGQIDLLGKVVQYIFVKPGSFPVTLKVTDNQGNTDSITKVVETK